MTSSYDDYDVKTRRTGDERSGERRDERGRLLCSAYGCPMAASICSGGSAWLCMYHYGAPATAWPRITERLRRPEVMEARRLLARLDAAISRRAPQASIPALIRGLRAALLKLGADPDKVEQAERVDHRGHPFVESPEEFAYRMRFVLAALLIPPASTQANAGKRPPINTAAIVSPEKDFEDSPF